MSEAPTPIVAPPDAAGSNAPSLSVTELSARLKRVVEDTFGYVRVKGEISQPKVAASGHCYLRLKDENACIDGIIWRGAMAKIRLRPEEGMEVVATGKLTTYPGRSSYQIIIEALELAGQGALLKLLEDRRRKLAAEGLFDEARKKPLPYLPCVIGVVTSPTGAVIRDILHRITDRFPCQVIVWPVKVQGEGAAEEVAAAIAGFNALPAGGAVPRPDLLIVARGGGSLEDLWAFNEEVVVRAAAASDIPLISAVGHETDTTLIDYASSRRAPTPTAAAEMAVPVRLDLMTSLQQGGARLAHAVTRLVEQSRIHLEGLVRGIPRLDMIVAQKTQDLDALSERLSLGPRALIQTKGHELAVLAAGLNLGRFARDIRRHAADVQAMAERFARALSRLSETAAHKMESLAARLESVSPARVLDRGYALVTAAEGAVVTSVAAAKPATALTVQFRDGRVGVRVEGAPTEKPIAKPRAARPRGDGGQGSLL